MGSLTGESSRDRLGRSMWGVTPLCLAVVLAACERDGQGVSTAGGSQTCHVDADCPTSQRCQLVETRAGLELAMVAPPAICYEKQCTLEVAPNICVEGQTCIPVTQAIRLDGKFWDSFTCSAITHVCGTPCQDDIECAEGERCRSGGQCELAPCDEPGAPACPAAMHCDPAVAATTSNPAVNGVTYDPAIVLGTARGCVVTTCDEAGGVECLELWRCDPTNGVDRGGCVPIPCQESGQCSSEAMICEPTSTRRRPTNTDAQGCIARNCDEGLLCSYTVNGMNVGYCDFDGPYSSATGCAALPCDQVDGSCSGGLLCDPGSPQADERGCRRSSCREEAACPEGYTCDPQHASADQIGCVSPAALSNAPPNDETNDALTSSEAPVGTATDSAAGESRPTEDATRVSPGSGAGASSSADQGSPPDMPSAVMMGVCVDTR